MIDGIIDFSSVDTTNSRDSKDFGFRASINRIHCITGTILGDGYIRPSTLTKNGIIRGIARFGLTIKTNSYEYLLKEEGFSGLGCNTPVPYPNPVKHPNLPTVHFSLTTLTNPFFPILHSMWYRYDPDLNKFVKIVPAVIKLIFLPLLHLIIQYGYWDNIEITIFVVNHLLKASSSKMYCLILTLKVV